MKIYQPHKTIKKILKNIRGKSSKRKEEITEDDMDHLGTQLYHELGLLSTEEEDAAYGLKEKGYLNPEPEDGM